MTKDTIILYYSGAKLRYNKDGSIDKRYKRGKEMLSRTDGVVRVGKSIPRRRIKKRKEKVWERVLEWVGGLFYAIVLIASIFKRETFDASLFITPTPRPVSALEFNLESKKAYLENPVTIEETKDYMRYKFGDNYKVACMVAYSEGLVSNRVNSTPYERSVGTFQINLADNFGQGTRIHWNKVPGETLEAKEAWLKVRKNNIDLAYKMSKGGTDWHQWSGYTNGSYLKHEEKCL